MELKEKIEKAYCVCQKCGVKYGRGFKDGSKQMTVSTWHKAPCDICGKKVYVTEFRDFGYAKGKELTPAQKFSYLI